MTDLDFNPSLSSVMHIDLNSCFATIEQQANPLFRGKPIAVAAYDTPNGCILAPSIEAKRYGIKTGMRVKDGKSLYPKLIVLKPDPWKYRNVHLSLRRLLERYTPDVIPKSIDEFILDFSSLREPEVGSLKKFALEIKEKIRSEIGEHLTVSVGISTNRLLAKLASNLEKPDGLTEIGRKNVEACFKDLKLIDLPYIKERNAIRLNSVGIYTLWGFYKSPLWKLKAAFQSINGYYWYMRLRGYEVDSVPFGRKSYGNSYALPKPLKTHEELSPILSKLVSKMCSRFRKAGYKVRGVHLAVSYRDGDFWHKGMVLPEAIFSDNDIYKAAKRLLSLCPHQKPVRDIFVSSFNLQKDKALQLDLFRDMVKKERLARFVDRINERWGNFVVTPGRMLGTGNAVPDRIAFGGVKELEEFMFDN